MYTMEYYLALKMTSYVLLVFLVWKGNLQLTQNKYKHQLSYKNLHYEKELIHFLGSQEPDTQGKIKYYWSRKSINKMTPKYVLLY